MKDEKTEIYSKEELRKKAEQKLSEEKKTKIDDTTKIGVLQKTIHELEVHQIELEMQNDELRNTQLKLKEMNKKYFDLYNLAPVGYLTLDENSKILELNLTAANLLGNNRNNLVNKNLYDIISREDRDIFYLHIQKMKETKSRQSCELKLLKNDGEEFYGHLECMPLGNSKGEISNFWTALMDVSKRVEAEEQNLRSQEKMKIMNTILRHDIANDLAVIKSAVNIFNRESKQEMIGEIEKRVKKSIRTITNYRASADFIESHLELYEIEVGEVLNKLKNEFPEVTIQINGDAKIYADEAINSVFSNLISELPLKSIKKKPFQ